MTNDRPNYVRALVPGDPARSTWVPVDQWDAAAANLRRDVEPSKLAHWLIVTGVWLMAFAIILLGSMWLAEYMTKASAPAVTRDVEMPRPTPYPGGWNYGKP